MFDQLRDKRPRLVPLFLTAEFVDYFSYWGLQSILVLYLTHHVGLALKTAYSIFGTFSAFSLAFVVLTGWISDRLWGFRNSLILGMFLLMLGNFMLALPTNAFFYSGLATIVCGSAFFISSNANLMNSVYQPVNIHRTRSFIFLHLSGNIGGVLGPLLYGLMGSSTSLANRFSLTGFITIVWLFFFYKQRKTIDVLISYNSPPLHLLQKNNNSLSKLVVLLLLVGIIYLIGLLIQQPILAHRLLISLGFLTLVSLIGIIFKCKQSERSAVLILVLMMAFALLFYANELQVDSSLLLFADSYVDRHLFNEQIPTTALASLESCAVILIAPCLATIWTYLGKYEPSPLIKIMLGLLLESVSFKVFSLMAFSAINSPTQKVSLTWFLLGNLLLGAGEVCLFPTLLANITQLAPARFKGTLLGMLFLSLAFSAYLAGAIAKLTASATAMVSPAHYALIYNRIAKISCIAALGGLLFYFGVRKGRNVLFP